MPHNEQESRRQSVPKTNGGTEPHVKTASELFPLVSVDDLTAKPTPIDWLIRGYCARDSLIFLIGEPSSGKTFLALDWMACIAAGKDWQGIPVKHGPVIMVAGEGRAGLARRLKAWKAVHQGLDGAPFFTSLQAASLTSLDNTAIVIAAIQAIADQWGPPAMVCVDTLARNFGPGDENSTKDAGAFIQNCDLIRQTFRCCVLIVHHTGHGEARRGRGSSALWGGSDVDYLVTKDDREITIGCHKPPKDWEQQPDRIVLLSPVDLDERDDEGRPLTSCVIRPAFGLPSRPAPEKVSPVTGIGKRQQEALDALAWLYDEQRAVLERAGNDPARARVLESDWRDKTGIPRNRWAEVREALLARGAVAVEAPYVYLA